MIYTNSPRNHNKTHRSEGLYFDGFCYPCELYAFYSMWNSRQGWGLVVFATIIIIMYRRSKVKTFSIISYEYTKMITHSSEHLYRIFNSNRRQNRRPQAPALVYVSLGDKELSE